MMGFDQEKLGSMYSEEVMNALNDLMMAMQKKQASGYDEPMEAGDVSEAMEEPAEGMPEETEEMAMEEAPTEDELGQEVKDFFSGPKPSGKSEGMAMVISSKLAGKKPKKVRGRRKKGY